jgi:hypothetical protein
MKFQQPYNLQECQNETIKLANFHILICKEETCFYLEIMEPKNKEKETENPNLSTTIPKPQYQHNFLQLLNDIFKKSYEDFLKQENDPSIFHKNSKHEASFDKQISTTLLDELATEMEKSACKINNVPTNLKRRSYYFYLHLNLYQNIAAQNYYIDKLNKQKAIDLLTSKPISTELLARVLTFFNSSDKILTYSQINTYYRETAYPKANKILQDKFQMSYLTPSLIEESLFLKETPFQ